MSSQGRLLSLDDDPRRLANVNRQGVRSFLGKVVPDAARNRPVRVRPGELRRVRVGFRVRGAVCVALECDRGNGDDRRFREPVFQFAVRRLTFCQSESPAARTSPPREAP